jgi:hypothetical protein
MYRVTVTQALATKKLKNKWVNLPSIAIYLASAAIWGVTLFPINHLETLPDALIATFAFTFFFFAYRAEL